MSLGSLSCGVTEFGLQLLGRWPHIGVEKSLVRSGVRADSMTAGCRVLWLLWGVCAVGSPH